MVKEATMITRIAASGQYSPTSDWRSGSGGSGTRCRSAKGHPHRLGKLLDVPVDVHVGGRGDRGVPQKALDGLEVAGPVENTLAGRGALLDETGSGEAGVPPVVQAVQTHGDPWVALVLKAAPPVTCVAAPDLAAAAEQVVPGAERQVVPEVLVDERQRLLALVLGHEREAAPLPVEVLEAHAAESGLA